MGLVDLNDIATAYDVSQHPKFKSGEMSKNDILSEFMAQWDTNIRDNKVTLDEFIDYYKDVSASVDEDDYFELMIRNAWHLAGGEGQYENTTIRRELHNDDVGVVFVITDHQLLRAFLCGTVHVLRDLL